MRNISLVYRGLDWVVSPKTGRNDSSEILRCITRAGGSILFNDKVTVLLDQATQVKLPRDDIQYSIDDVSVGQAVIFGTLNDDSSNPILDASLGTVTMKITSSALCQAISLRAYMSFT